MIHKKLRWAAIALLVIIPRFGAAQSGRQATIAFVHTLADSSAIATIIREPGPNGRTLVMLRESADRATLATALTSLANSRRKDGDTLTHEVVITIRGQRSLASLSDAERRVADYYVSRLRNAQLQQLDRVGHAKVLSVPLATLQSTGGS